MMQMRHSSSNHFWDFKHNIVPKEVCTTENGIPDKGMWTLVTQPFLGGKKRVYNLWKKGRATQEDYKDVMRLCREKIRRAKAQQEINLATAVKDNKKMFL